MSDSPDAAQSKMSLWDFNADTPIFSEGQDTLHRAVFAKQIAQILLQTRAIKDEYSGPNKTSEQVIEEFESGKIPIPESHTIAVLGSWGSGKTSLKNLICKEIEGSTAACKPDIASFEPLRWRDEDTLILDFFKTLSKAVDSENNEKAEEAAKELLQLGDYFAMANIAALSGSAAGVALGLTTSHPSFFLIGLVSTLFLKTSLFLTERGKRMIDKAKGQSLVDKIDISVRKLKKEMLQLEAPVIMFIDDIDRLTPKEVTFLFQLLKFNANFPNVFYVILGQRDIIEAGLEQLYPGYGNQYLEKFVQVAIDLPSVESQDIRSLALDSIGKIAKKLGFDPVWTKSEFEIVYESGVAPYLNSLRRLHRYMNSLQFLVSLCVDSAGKNVVHPVDFALLEIIRLYEPNVYKLLYRCKPFLTKTFFDIEDYINKTYNRQAEKNGKKKELGEIIEVLQLKKLLDESNNQGALRVLLNALSPNLEGLFKYLDPNIRSLNPEAKKSSSYAISPAQRAKDERFNTTRSFDRYFMFKIERNRLTLDEKQRLVSTLSNRRQLLEMLRELTTKDKIDDTLSEIYSAVETLKVDGVPEFVAGMIDWSDEVPQPNWQPNSISGQISEIGRIIVKALAKEESIEEAIGCFERVAQNAAGIYIVFHMARLVENSLVSLAEEFPEIQKREEVERTEMTNRISRVVEIAVQKIGAVIKNDSEMTPLEDRVSFGLIIYWWSKTDKQNCREWVLMSLQNPKCLSRFAQTMTSTREIDVDTVESKMYPSPIQAFSLLKMEDLISLDALENIMDSMSCKGLDVSDVLWIKTLHDAVNKWKNGEKFPYTIIGECPAPQTIN